MFLKRLFYASAAILCLALAHHLGAASATAQAPANPVVAAVSTGPGFNGWVATANGQIYHTVDYGATWQLAGDVFSGGPTPVQRETFGALKSRYRGAPGVAQPTQDR